jgi:hypothetical protein
LIENALRKYGVDSFQTCVIDTAESQEELDRLEAYYIESWGTLTPNGYNLRSGGKGKGIVHPETIERMRESARNSPAAQAHRIALTDAQRGVPRKPEDIAPLIKHLRDRKNNPELLKRIGESLRNSPKHKAAAENRRLYYVVSEGTRILLRGRVVSEETRRKLSEALKASPRAITARQQLADHLRGRPGHKHTEEHKRKMSLLYKGRTFSPETIEKMRIAAQARVRRKREEALG